MRNTNRTYEFVVYNNYTMYELATPSTIVDGYSSKKECKKEAKLFLAEMECSQCPIIKIQSSDREVIELYQIKADKWADGDYHLASGAWQRFEP